MLKELKKTYKGKKVFLTGHTGFKGAWLLKTLNILGAEVMGYALAPRTKNDLYNLINGDKICNSIIADLREKDKLKKAVLDFQPDFVFHLAAQPLVRLSYEIPTETFEINAIGTANLLEAVRFLDKKCSIILITTDKVYFNNEWIYPYRENDRLGGYDPYSASKACAELIIDSYRNSFFNSTTIEKHQKGIAVARAGNVIGGGDFSKDRIIPDIILSLRTKKDIIVRNQNAVRPWQHVLEPILGYLQLGINLNINPIAFSNPYNFGPFINDQLTVKELVELAIQSWGTGSWINSSNNLDQPHEAGLLKLDISRSINDLLWKPKLNSKEAISLTIDWYKQPEDLILEYTTDQIKNYLNNDF